jgi:hypothetical protein
MKDNVNSPSHYQMGNKETIRIIEDMLGQESFIAYCQGNVAKYISRFQHKNGVEDLRKAEWYLKKLIMLLDNEVEQLRSKKGKTL